MYFDNKLVSISVFFKGQERLVVVPTISKYLGTGSKRNGGLFWIGEGMSFSAQDVETAVGPMVHVEMQNWKGYQAAESTIP
jgi:hypothetical protein